MIINGKELSSEAAEVLEHWNSKKIIQHKATNQDIARHLSKVVEPYDVKEIKQSIDNYTTMYFDDNYKPSPAYMPYKFTLMNFLRYDRHICDYLDDGQKWINYCRYKEQRQQPIIKFNTIPEPKQQASAFLMPQNAEVETLYQMILQQLKSMPYGDYIETSHWQHFRKEALKHFNHTCQLCGASGVLFDVHHKTYINRGRETFNDVIVLCRHCHDMYHHSKDISDCSRCNGEDGEHQKLK